MESKGKAWMAASAAMLALSILVASGPVISAAINQRPFSEAYGIIPETGSCADKLGVFVDSQRDSNTLFRKSVRDYFEQQTGCLVEETPFLWGSGGNYASEFFPKIDGFEYTVLDAVPYRVGGSFGSIPAWKVTVRYEIEIENKPGWGLCAPGTMDSAIFSGDWQSPQWPSNDAAKWLKSKHGEWWFDEYWLPNYGKDSQFWSRYSVSFEKSFPVTDQYGPILEAGVYVCGNDEIFQNSTDSGMHYLGATYYLDPADLAPYNIPFYSWMGW